MTAAGPGAGMRILLIRHGMTAGNLERRYVGSTDEGLLPQAAETLRRMSDGFIREAGRDGVFISPARRCRETAEILYPGREYIVVPDFRECDFGEFEYRNFGELDGNPAYQRYIDSDGTCGFPGGETLAAFEERCVRAFGAVTGYADIPGTVRVAVVAHGGTIMALLDRYSKPHRDFFSWQVENGGFFDVYWDGESLTLSGGTGADPRGTGRGAGGAAPDRGGDE